MMVCLIHYRVLKGEEVMFCNRRSPGERLRLQPGDPYGPSENAASSDSCGASFTVLQNFASLMVLAPLRLECGTDFNGESDQL